MVDNLDWAAAAQNRGESFEVGEEVVADVRIHAVIKMVPPNTIPRSEGKAKRVFDNRMNPNNQ